MTLLEIQSLAQSLKAAGMDSAVIKNAIANTLNASGTSWDDTVDVPKFGDDGVTVVDNTPTKISDVVNKLLSSDTQTDPNENWEQAKAEAAPKVKSKEAQDRLEADRIAAVPENEAQAAEERERINDNSPITAGVAQSGLGALFADLDKAKAKGLIQWVKNNVNLLTGNKNDEANRAAALNKLNILSKAKENGKSFTDALKDMFTPQELADLAKERKGKGTKELFNSLKTTYEADEFGENARKLAALTSKTRRAQNSVARNEERLADALQNPEDTNASATHKKWLRGENGGTAFDKATSDGTELSASLKAMMNNAVNMLEQGHGDILNKATNIATKAQYTTDDWLKYFSEHPEARFKNTANANTVNKKVLLLSQFDNDNPGGKKIVLAREADVENFLDALRQADKAPKIETDYTNLRTKATDDTDDVSRNKKILERYNQMFTTGDSRYVFQDQSVDKLIDRDDNGFVTETDRDKKRKSGYKIDDNYFRHLANIFKTAKPEELMEWYRGNGLSDGNSVASHLASLKTLGEDSTNKATQLGKDVIDLMYGIGGKDPAMDQGINLDSDLYDESTLRSLANKIRKLHDSNPDASIADIVKGGNVGDVFGKIHEGYGKDVLPLVRAFLKLDKYDKTKDDNLIDLGELRGDLDTNIQAVKNAIAAGDFSTIGKDMTPEYAQEVLDKLNTARQFLSTNKERNEMISDQVGRPSLDSLKSLADEDPEYFEKVSNDLMDAALELRAAKKSNADFDIINMLRDRVSELRSTQDYLKNTKVDLEAQAKESGKSYQEVLNDYLHPDWLEDDDERTIDKLLAKYDMMDNLKSLAGGNNINNKNVKYSTVAEVLDKLAGINPKLDNWKEKLQNYTAPLPKSQLLASQQASKDVLGLTPEEWSAWTNNNELFKSDTEQKRRNTARVGYKSKAGAYGADTDATKLAEDLQNADYTDNPEQKQAAFDKVAMENEKSAKPYTKHIEAKDRMDNAKSTLESVIDTLVGRL